jgi:microcystin-dependent protein
MANPFVGQIIMFAGNYAPQGWALCDGHVLAIADYQPLFSVIGTTYGGDGTTTFALPNLCSRVPIGEGQGPRLSNYQIGEAVGVEAVGLIESEIPQHSHPAAAANHAGTSNVPAGNAILSALGGEAASQEYQTVAYAPPANQTHLNPNTVGPTGGGQPHPNLQPYLAINYCISLFGIVAPRS